MELLQAESGACGWENRSRPGKEYVYLCILTERWFVKMDGGGEVAKRKHYVGATAIDTVCLLTRIH